MAIELTTSTLSELSGIRVIIQGPVPAHDIGSLSGSFTPDLNNGFFQKVQITGDSTIGVPTNGTEGAKLELWITPSSAADRTVSLNAAIKIPSDSGITFPKTLTKDKTYIVLLKYNGTAWFLVSFVGGY